MVSPEKDTRKYFDTDDYRLLVVANKYLTGFDQPKLCTMYVDKKLQGRNGGAGPEPLKSRRPIKLGQKDGRPVHFGFLQNQVERHQSLLWTPFYTGNIP